MNEVEQQLTEEYLTEIEADRQRDLKQIHWDISDICEEKHDHQTEYAASGKDGFGKEYIGTAVYVHGDLVDIENIEDA